MSHPPRPRPERSTTGTPPGGQSALDYLPLEHQHFLDLQRELAAKELGIVSGEEEGDFTRTLLDLPAVVAHILSMYQDRYAGEAYLSTAQAASSLVRHARRLAYEPDPGLAATGYLVLEVRDGEAGTVEEGFQVGSLPTATKKAQTYETLADVAVDAGLNRMRVDDGQALETGLEVTVDKDLPTFVLSGTGLGLEAGDLAVLHGSTSGALLWGTLGEVDEDEDEETTTVTFDDASIPGGAGVVVKEAAELTLYVRPKSRYHLFGWDSSPTLFSGDELKGGTDGGDPEEANTSFYTLSAGTLGANDVLLVPQAEEAVGGLPLLRLLGSTYTGLTAKNARASVASFQKVGAAVISVSVTGWNEATNTVTSTDSETTYPITSISGAVTAVDIGEARNAQDVRSSVWLGGWEVAAPLATTRRSTTSAGGSAVLAGGFTTLAEQKYVVLSHPTEDRQEVAQITAVTVTSSTTTIDWVVVDPTSGGYDWKLGYLEVLGNVATVSHGKTVEQTLGGSDGVTPFQRFTLKEAPLTWLPGAGDPEPAIEVRVSGVLWTRVLDFYDSGPEDLHYRLERDEAGDTTVVFGDGIHGAIPGSGKKSVTAAYRVGLGTDGNTAASTVTRIKKSNPLVGSVWNPTPLSGGADAADAEDVRTQATRYIRTFERAVSVPDHADLALLYPGVARAAASWGPIGGSDLLGVRLIVADASGLALGSTAQEGLLAFLGARRDTQLPLELVDPEAVDLHVELLLESGDAWLEEAVQDAVRAALHGDDEDSPGLFTFAARDLGQPAFLSELVAAVMAVDGVDDVVVTALNLGVVGEAEVADTVRVGPHQWLRLTADNLDFAASEEG